MSFALQVLLTGVLLGGLYACMAIAFSLIWGVTNIINLAHGSMIILGSYLAWTASQAHINPFLALPICALCLFVFGFLLQRFLFERFSHSSITMTLILTFGLNMVLINIFLAVFTADFRSIPSPIGASSLQVGDLRLPYLRLLVCVFGLLLTAGLHVFVNRTRTGLAIRAIAQNPRAAMVLGMDSRRLQAIAFGVGAALAGAAGVLMGMIYAFAPSTGDSLTIRSFLVVILGGLGTIQGVIAGGMLLGISENVVSAWMPEYRDVVSFALLLAVLLIRPGGLLGTPSAAPHSVPETLPQLSAKPVLAWTSAVALILLGIVLAAAPTYLNAYWLRVASTMFMYVVLAQGMNLIAGYAGYPAFGNVVFFGLSSYCTGLLLIHFPDLPFWIAISAGTALCIVLALSIGPSFLKLKGHYFAIATLALNEMIREIIGNWSLAGAGSGLSLPLTPWRPAVNAVVFYYLFLGAAVLSVIIVWQFSRRKIGLVCRSIRDDEEKAEAIGLHTVRDKALAWTLSAGLTGLVGGINAYWISFINPSSAFDLGMAVEAYVAFLIGGAATIFGPVLGAFLVELLSTLSWTYLLKWHLAVMGLLVMVVILVAPDGILSGMQRMLRVIGRESKWASRRGR